MSANDFEIYVIKRTGSPYNLYTVVTNGKKYIIGGVPDEFSETYIDAAEGASALVLLTAKPEFTGGVAEVVKSNPEIEVYATAAGLRNIKEIINSDINEKLIKDGMMADALTFAITPNLPWVDTAVVGCGTTLFSGELFSCDEQYYRDNLAVNRTFVASAIERIKHMGIESISPAIGDGKGLSVISEYEAYLDEKIPDKPIVSVIYSSRYGFTEAMAEFCASEIPDTYEVYLTTAEDADMAIVNSSERIIIGTNTINRNAPESVWNVITHLDLVNKRQMPYFVFGSFGWAGDGIKLVDKTLQAMGMKQVQKPVEVLFCPSASDFEKLHKAVAKLLDT